MSFRWLGDESPFVRLYISEGMLYSTYCITLRLAAFEMTLRDTPYQSAFEVWTVHEAEELGMKTSGRLEEQ